MGRGALAFALVVTFIVHQRLSNSVSCRGKSSRRLRSPGRPREVARVTSGDVPITIDSLGTVTPLATVTVHPQAHRTADRDRLRRGPAVKAGDCAGRDRPTSLPGVARPVAGSAAHDRALLANARVDLERYKTLVGAELRRRADLCNAAGHRAAGSGDGGHRHSHGRDRALNLSYTPHRSPVTGTVGLRQVDMRQRRVGLFDLDRGRDPAAADVGAVHDSGG